MNPEIDKTTHMKKIQKFLEKLGLSANERAVYIAVVHNNGSPVSTIAKMAQVHRVAAYQLIEKLEHKGLVHQVVEENVKHVYASSPHNMRKMIYSERRKLRKLELQYDDILVEFQQMRGTGFHPAVQTYYGRSGIRTIQEDIVNSVEKHEEVYSVVNLEMLYELFPQYLEDDDYRGRRWEKAFVNKVIVLGGENAEALVQEDPKEQLTKVRFVAKERFPLTMNMTIYGGKVSITSLREPIIGVIIESPEIAENMKLLHAMAWETAEIIRTHI